MYFLNKLLLMYCFILILLQEYDENTSNGLSEVSLKTKDNYDIFDELLNIIGQPLNVKGKMIIIILIMHFICYNKKKKKSKFFISSLKLFYKY